MRSRAIVKKLAPLLISGLALAAVFGMADLSAFSGLAARVCWGALPAVGVLLLAIVAAISWRWHSLLREALPLPRAVLVSSLGVAGNQLLPLRGGDALRVVLSARGQSAPSLHAGVSAMAMEKVFDLLAVAAFGLASASAALGTRSSEAGINVIAVAVTIVGFAAAFLLTSRSGLLVGWVRTLARALRFSPRLYRHVFGPLHHIRQVASPIRVAVLLLQTGLIWIALYVLAYLAVAYVVGIPLNVSETMVLLFAGALGLAIPAAPSGLGTYHAAIVSAFVLLDRPAADGLVLAVAMHGVFFVGFCVIGTAALAIVSRKIGSVRTRNENA